MNKLDMILLVGLVLLFLAVMAVSVQHYFFTAMGSTDPSVVMANTFQTAKNHGIARKISPQTVNFAEGSEYDTNTIAGEGLSENNITRFCCIEYVDERCEGYQFPPEFFECEAHSLTVKKATSGKIMADCSLNETRADSISDCLIGLKLTD